MITSLIEVHPIELRGQRFTVRLDEAGTFRAFNEAGAEAATSQTRQGLISDLSALTKQASAAVSVPITVLVNGEARHGEVTGVHAANRNFLIRWADGECGQLSAVRSSDVLGGMTEDEGREWARLTEAVLAAGRGLHAFRETHQIDLHAKVRAAMAAHSAAD